MKKCVQCNNEIDFIEDDLTLYQFNKERYLYCATCQNPKEPYTSPAQITDMKVRISMLENTINKSWKGKIVLFIIGIAVGWFIHEL